MPPLTVIAGSPARARRDATLGTNHAVDDARDTIERLGNVR